MKIAKLLLYSVASALVLAGCTENEEDFGDPSINVNPAELSFGQEGSSNTVALVATRDWTATVEPSDADWITVEPSSGDASTDAQTVTVTVLENTGANRTATVTFAANNGTVSAPLEVTQTGPGGEPELEIITIAEFLKANVSDDVWYTLKGQITDLYNTDYGNFTLVDETGSVKVYGLTAEKVDKNDQSFSTLGLKEGDTVTLCGTRDEYGGESQVGGPAYYISHEPGEEEPEEPVDPDSPYVSNVTWSLGPNSYNEEATVNGEGPVDVVKIGKSKTKGSIDITIPSGTTQVNFYAVSWNSETATLSFVMNGQEVAFQSIAKNAGAANSQPYTFTVTESDYYTFKTPMPLSTDMTITVTTQENARAILWGIKAVSE